MRRIRPKRNSLVDANAISLSAGQSAVGDLVAGIERRQRGLDAQQEEVQAQIAKLLSADWFSAVARRCSTPPRPLYKS
jgi:chromosome condensin MukBEF complex kleisin-like MukF subunit